MSELAGGQVDVVGASEVIVNRRTEEPVAIGESFDDAGSEYFAIPVGVGLEDLEDEILFAQAAGVFDIEGLGMLDEVLNLGLLERGELDVVRCGAFPFGGAVRSWPPRFPA